MANFFSNLFGYNKGTGNAGYNGPKPYGSLLDAAGGQDYYTTLKNRMAGQGVGYGDAYTSYANPQMANLRSNFQDYQLPELKSYLSATGRTGSPGSQAVQQAGKEEGLTENSIMAQLMQRNAESQHNDVNSAISGLGAFNQADAAQRGALANFEMGNTQNQVAQANRQAAARAAGMQQMGQGAVELAAAPFTGGASLGMGGFSNPFSQTAPTGFNPQTMSTMPYGYNMGQGGGSIASKVKARQLGSSV